MKTVNLIRILPAILLPVLLAGCGGPQLEVDPRSFAGDWNTYDADHFVIHVPPDSPRSNRVLLAYAVACEEVFEQATIHLELEVPELINIYHFTTNQDCEEAIGHSAGFVEAYNVYTRIGGEMGGAIALAMCHSIDPEAASFPLIKDGLRTVFDERHLNIHREASEVLNQAGRWFSLPELIAGLGSEDQEAYRYAAGSFVAFLIQRHGPEKFKMLWRSVLELGPSLERIYGATLDQLEMEWQSHLVREAKRT
jgi:hypothetical protein